MWSAKLVLVLVAVVAARGGPVDDLLFPQILPDGSYPDIGPPSKPAPAESFTRADCDKECRDPSGDINNKDNPWRLKRDVIPNRYVIYLNVDVDNFFYQGSVIISVEADVATDKVTLHSEGLKLDASKSFVTLPEAGKEYARVTNITEDKEHFTVTLQLSKALEKQGKYDLHLESFSGEIRRDLSGFYRSSYKVGNETRWLATTQFEPTHARKAFPCFDEPDLKALFTIMITHDTRFRAISNMPIFKSLPNGNKATDIFETTEVMSTYLIAFIVSDFWNYTNGDLLSNVWATPEYIRDAEYTQGVGLQAVYGMEKFTNIKFALPKIDHVAIPDFSAGAMENWGLITYRDYMLIKRDNSIITYKQAIPTVISHEVGHQWFGNLVTLEWWSYTWLNEGFATFMENFITEEFTNGSMALWDQFIPSKFQVALGLDGNPATSVAMTSPAYTPQEISGKFDQISYGKGGCILRMISELLQVENFKKGLTQYLEKRKFKNAKPDDLFEELQKVSDAVSALPKDIDFIKFAKSWTEQDGVPLVTATRNYETGDVVLKQKRFFEIKPQCECRNNKRWWVPITWVTEKQAGDNPAEFKPQAWLRADKENEEVVVKPGADAGQWLLLNKRSVGYFRVNYDERNWELLAAALEADPGKFSVPNRAQIINDAYVFASLGDLNFTTALDVFKFIKKERNTAVWISAVKILSGLMDKVGPTSAFSLFEEFGRVILNDTYATVRLTVDPKEEHLKSLLRYYIGSWSCNFGVEQCIKDAQDNLAHHTGDSSAIHPDVVSATVCGAVRGANEEAFWRIRQRIMTVGREDVKSTIIAALPCTNEAQLIKKHLEDAIKSDSTFPKDSVSTAIAAVISTAKQFDNAFQFFRDNLDQIKAKVGDFLLENLAVQLIRKIRTQNQLDQVGDWVRKNIDKIGDKDRLNNTLAQAQANTVWNTQYLYDVAHWLAKTLGRDPPPDIVPPPQPW